MVFINLIKDNAQVPTKNNPSDTGFDLYSTEKKIINIGTCALISTGIRITDFPENTYARIAPRSGLSTKGISVGAGVVDSSYTGEIKVLLMNHCAKPAYIINPGDRIAQLIFEKYESNVSFKTVDEQEFNKYSENCDRKESGFGSSGV